MRLNERISGLRRRVVEKRRSSRKQTGAKEEEGARRARDGAERAKARARRERDAAEDKPAQRNRSKAGAPRASGAIQAAVGGLGERGRRLLAIPAAAWLAVAEALGAAVLVGWRRALRPGLVLAAAAVATVYRLAKQHLTPARGVAAVAVVALIALGVSQWLDYRSISVGTNAYSDEVDLIASAPDIDVQRAGTAHAWVMVPLAAAGLAALALALTGRPWAGRGLVLVGIGAIAISLLVDAPKGLDEGQAAVVYDGAAARLLEGFWLQVAAGVSLIACGLLLPSYLRAGRRATSSAAKRDRRRRPGPAAGIDGKRGFGEAST